VNKTDGPLTIMSESAGQLSKVLVPTALQFCYVCGRQARELAGRFYSFLKCFEFVARELMAHLVETFGVRRSLSPVV